MALRERMLTESCAFSAVMTADFGDKVYEFTLDCTSDTEGAVTFSVTKPDEISGIGGSIHANSGKLDFTDSVLAFPLLAEGEITPVSGPWILVSTLRGGYLSSCGMDGESLRLTIYDSYREDALLLDVWLNAENLPTRCDIFWQGRRVLSMDIKDFRFV